MSHSNKQALDRVKRALRDLILLKHNGQKKTPKQIADIDTSVDRLNDEYLRLIGIDPEASYADIAKSISSATDSLKAIIEDRKELEDKLVTARNIIQRLGSVLELVL